MAYFPLAPALSFELNNSENECSQPCQDSKGRTEAVLKKEKNMWDVHACVSVCVLVLFACSCLFAKARVCLVPQCFMVLHKNKWSLSDFNYNKGALFISLLLLCERGKWIWCI